MRGEHTIEFDVPFQYSDGGKFKEASSITVRAPGLGKYHIHTVMVSFVYKGLMSFTTSGQAMKEIASYLKPVEDEDEDGDQQKAEDDPEKDIMPVLAIGLGTETYPQFAAFVRKSLTDSPKLATIGDTGLPVTDEVWESIEETSGIDEVMRVFNAFTNFFNKADSKSKKGNGKKRSRGSSSRTKAASTTSTP